MSSLSAIRNYSLVTAAYWAFTLTDGALRMLVLLHFHELGYTPVQLAFLFLFYEFFGVVTNLVGGWIASRMGLRVTLLGGLALQVVSLVLLGMVSPAWSKMPKLRPSRRTLCAKLRPFAGPSPPKPPRRLWNLAEICGRSKCGAGSANGEHQNREGCHDRAEVSDRSRA